MNHPKSQAYNLPEINEKMMGPNPLKLLEELLIGHRISSGAAVMDLGSGRGDHFCLPGKGIWIPCIRHGLVERSRGKSALLCTDGAHL